MSRKIIYIKQPSQRLIEFVEEIRARKEREKQYLIKNKDKYLSKNK